MRFHPCPPRIDLALVVRSPAVHPMYSMSNSRFPFTAVVLIWFGSFVIADEIDFDRQIRPILSDKCFHCHGPDEATRSAGLRLDTAEGASEDLGGYAAFRAGDLENSEGIRRILSEDPDEVMPPPESKIELTRAEKELLQRWVESGAKWSEHWSFVAPRMPVIPEDVSGWSRNDLDRFVRARAEVAGLTPSNEATRETLIRRLSLDLTGLPPTPEEVDAFVSDPTPDAYEQLVDRLLESPRYGERMAWEWMDAARYADTDGFQGDPTRTMWPWRDWLVNALNDNMPFDQFTIEMLAGDLIPDATQEQILASAFNRNHMFNGEGGRIPEETRVENVFDRCETTGTVWLGLTMTCCRCHDHKYDSISQKEYFELYAFFDNTSETGRSGRGKTEPVLKYLGPAVRAEREQLSDELRAVEQRLLQPNEALDQQQLAWESDVVKSLGQADSPLQFGPWWQLGPITGSPKKLFDNDDGVEKQVDLNTKHADETNWLRQPKLKDGEVFELPETVGATYFYRTIDSPDERKLRLSLGSDDAIKVFCNGKKLLENYASRAAAVDQEFVNVELKKGSNELLIKVVNTGGIGGVYFRKAGESVGGLPAELVATLRTDRSARSNEQRQELQKHYRSRHWDAWKRLSARQSQLQKRLNAIKANEVTVMVMDQLPADKLRETRILERGGYDKPTDVIVTANTPSALPPLAEGTTRDRLALARWLVDPDHPLTARVTVNRYWQTFFGRGLVASTEDFGIQGARPTHPELLDWLALTFIRSGWNVKQLYKQIVMSATYRQSSHVDEEAFELDPENKWLARAPRYRLPSWMLRDQALSVSGLMNPAMGGPAVKPYQPKGIWAEATFGKIKYKPDQGDKLYRRSLYVFWRRIIGPTMFFDGAKRQTCEVKPTRTNTPLHALTTLNETTYVEAARGMAARVLSQRDSKSDRLRYAFQIATSRSPTESELQVLARRIDALQTDFTDHPQEAIELLSVGDSPRDETLEPPEHAAYAMVCSVLLNLDETLSRP